jgi:hypothetical protein
LKKASFAVAATSAVAMFLFAVPDAANARVRSADAIGQCLDAENGARAGANLIAWNCYYNPSHNNQHFWLDWLTEAQVAAIWPAAWGQKRQPLALIRNGNFCVDARARHGNEEVKLSADCSKDRFSGVIWAPSNVGGNRFSIRTPGPQPFCMKLWGGLATAMGSLNKKQEVRVVDCKDGGSAGPVGENLWQYWFVEQ